MKRDFLFQFFPVKLIEIGMILTLILPFLLSFLLENFLNLTPCILCITERWMHFATFFTYILLLYPLRHKNFGVAVVIAANLLTTIYHLGVENHIFVQSCGTFSIENIHNINTDCSIPQYFLDIKMTIWNIIYCLIELCGLYFTRKLWQLRGIK